MSKQKMTQPSSGNLSAPATPVSPVPAAPDIPTAPASASTDDVSISVNIYRPSPKGPVLANATATVAGYFAIRGIRVLEGKNGPFVSMPSRKVGDEYKDVCFPCTKEFKAKFDSAVLAAYGQELGQAMSQQTQTQGGPAMAM